MGSDYTISARNGLSGTGHIAALRAKTKAKDQRPKTKEKPAGVKAHSFSRSAGAAC
jgi:hypothetical protein